MKEHCNFEGLGLGVCEGSESICTIFWVFCEESRGVTYVLQRDLEGFRFSIGQFLKGEGSRAEVHCDFEGICVLDWECNCDFAWVLIFFFSI